MNNFINRVNSKKLNPILIEMKYLFLLLFLINLAISADEKIGGQEIIERLDKTLTINEGLTRARLSIKRGNHETHFWKVNIFKQGDDVLYTFEVTHRNPVSKLLSVKRGSKLIYYNVLSGKFFQIEQMERMENVLHTAFTYLDISHYSYEANYSAEDINKLKTESSESSVVKMIPISFPSYKYLELLVDNTDYTPRKLDFTSPEGLLIKTLKFKYGNLKVRENNYTSEMSGLTKLEMTDNATGYTSILEFKEWDKDVKTDKILYEMNTMYEK
jgi:hypothetical protein